MGLDSSSSTQPRTSPERTYEILRHTSWPKEASRRANANCLHPAITSADARSARCSRRTSLPLFAEFSRASERGRRRVQNFIKDAKGMCKKITKKSGASKVMWQLPWILYPLDLEKNPNKYPVVVIDITADQEYIRLEY